MNIKFLHCIFNARVYRLIFSVDAILAGVSEPVLSIVQRQRYAEPTFSQRLKQSFRHFKHLFRSGIKSLNIPICIFLDVFLAPDLNNRPVEIKT